MSGGVMHFTSPSHDSIMQHILWEHAAYALREMGAFWRCASGNSIPKTESRVKERDGMKVMIEMLVVQVQVARRTFT